MAERENLSVDWDKYLDQSIDLVNMARKVAFLEADKRVLAEENNKLKRELHEVNLKILELAADRKRAIEKSNEQAKEHEVIDHLLERKIEEMAHLRRKLGMAERWIEAIKKESENNVIL